MTPIQQQRLFLLADYLETIPDERFNMQLFGSPGAYGNSCGTVGCALGHATALFPEITFDRQGFLILEGSEDSGYDLTETDMAETLFGTSEPFFAEVYGKLFPTRQEVIVQLRQTAILSPNEVTK